MADYPAVPQTSFKSPANGSYFYNVWDHRISPHAYIERVLGGFAQSIDDKRSYLRKPLLEHLFKGGAEVVEKSTNIGDGTPTSAQADEYALMFGDEPNSNRTYDLVWYKGCLIVLEGRDGEVQIETFGPVKHPIEPVHREFEPFLAPRKRAAVSVLLSTPGGMTTKSVDFEPPVIDDLELNYGTGFKKVDEQIVGKLRANKGGLVLFNGLPGSGKSTYIKHLTSRIDREFIFVPVGMAGELSSPSFLSLLLEHERAILVLEDAEQALQSREVDHWNSSTVSTLLNLTDGILGSMLSITALCTFNCDKQTLDPALLRKGRLAYSHSFGKLSIKDSLSLALHLKKGVAFITEPTSLADIYNAEDDTGYVAPVEKMMGFGMVKG